MPPVVRSQTAIGPLGTSGLVPRSQRWVSFEARIDMGNLLTLDTRMEEALHRHLMRFFGEGAQLVIERAQSKLYPGHGYDTGLMQSTLTAKLVDTYMGSLRAAVAYDLESDQADYWVWVEFGHMTRAGNWWPGYHFLTSSVVEMEGVLRQKVMEAWAATVLELAGQAAVGGVLSAALGGPRPWAGR